MGKDMLGTILHGLRTCDAFNEKKKHTGVAKYMVVMF